MYILKTQQIWKVNWFQGKNKPEINTVPNTVIQSRSSVSEVFYNANTHLSEMFYFNISESQTYSKYYHCQANIPILSPSYVPPSTSVQTCKPMWLTVPRPSDFV